MISTRSKKRARARGRQPSGGWLLVALLALFSTPFWAGAGRAAILDDLYEAQVPVADRSERVRNEAFGAALAAVAVRVSGRSDAGARLGAGAATVRRLVQRYGYDGAGLMTVGFDSAAVDRLLETAGLPVWGRERPKVVVALPAAVDTPELRAAMEQVARTRGIPLAWDGGGVDKNDATQLAALAARYQADALLLAEADSAASPVWRWSFVMNGGMANTQGAAADAMNFAADQCARLFAVAGASNQVSLDVVGVNDLDAYAKTLNYLTGLSLVRSVSVESVARDTVRFKLSLRGDQETLRRTIALGQRLAADNSAGGQLAFRYQP